MERVAPRQNDLEGRSNALATPIRFRNLSVCFQGPPGKPGGMSSGAMMASFQFEADISPLFPYINAVVEKAELFQVPRFIRFRYENRYCALYPDGGLVTPVDDQSDALSFVEKLMAFLADISRNRNEIAPNHRVCRRSSVLDILKVLPKTNCGDCGFASCTSAPIRSKVT